MPTAKAGAQCQVPVPSPPPRHGGRQGLWGQARPMGAGEADGGNRRWWGQVRPMGAASHRPHARARQHRTLGKPPGQIPSQHSPLAQGFPDETNQRNKEKSEILLRIPNPIKSKSKENPNIQCRSNRNPNSQCKSKYTIGNKANPRVQILPVILSKSNLLHQPAELNSPEGVSESICQHLRTRHVVDLYCTFCNGFMARVVPE